MVGRSVGLLVLLALLAPRPAAAGTFFVTPTGNGPGYGTDGGMVAERTLAFSTETMRAVLPGDVVQLLLDSPDPGAVTLYRERVVLARKGGRTDPTTVIKGLGARTRMVGKTVDQIRDCPMPKEDVEQSCGDLAALVAPSRKLDLLSTLTDLGTAEEEPRPRGSKLAIPIGRTGRLAEAACLDLDRVDGVAVEDLAFQDCWLAAVRAIGSRRVTLRRSLVIGSSYGLAARGRADRPSDDLVVEDVTWVQDASGFEEGSLTREGPFRCRDGRTTELGCPGIMWRSIPWGVSHHGVYEHFNGGLLGGTDIQGPIVFRRNKILAAYNGIRLKANACQDRLAVELNPASCPYNASLWIYDNLFSYVRDNPVELEVWATDGHIFRNRIHNSHAWFSFDGMGGGPVYVYGNKGWFDDMPALAWSPAAPGGAACTRHPVPKAAAKGSFDAGLDRRFDYLKARWLPIGVEEVTEAGDVAWMDAQDLTCEASVEGRAIKLALPGRDSAPGTFRYATRGPIYVFNNSWYLRIPVTGIGAAANLRFWNNALLFCEPGAPGYDEELCKVRPEAFDASVCGREFVRSDDLGRFTGAKGAVPFFDCFRWLPTDEKGHDLPLLVSAFDYDVSSDGFPRAFEGMAGFERHGRVGDPGFQAPERGDFTLVSGALSATSECLVSEMSDGGLECARPSASKPFAGAVGPDGQLYEPPASPRFRPPR